MVSYLEEPSEGAGPNLVRARETPAPREPGRDQLVAARPGGLGAIRNHASYENGNPTIAGVNFIPGF